MSQQRKKKVEWSSNLSSSEPQPTENRSPMWDTESDHLLSYFLGNNGVSSPPTGTQFTTTTPPGQSFQASSQGGNGLFTASSSNRPPIPSGPSSSFRSMSASGPGPAILATSAASVERRQDGITMDQENDEDDMPGPPPTPAIQHYYPSSSSQSNKSQQNKSSANSILKTSSFDASSSSAPSQYAPQHPPPLGPNGMPTIKHGFLPPVGKPHLPSSGSTGSMSLGDGSSPISPAMMIGGDHEPMMLPPPESQAAAKARASHLEWLRQINALAQANNTNGIAALASQAQASPMPATYGMVPNGSVGMAPPHQHQANIQVPTNMAQQHQHQQHQPPTLATFPPPGVALHPTAAAALAAANNPLFFSHAAAILRHHASSPVETEEKRAKRLERNRESARKSRRRKKERLNNLEGKVNAMHNRIDKERRIQINSMEKVLGEHEQERILQLVEEYSNQEGDDTRDERLGNALSHLLSSTNEFTIRKDIVEFQYTTLSQYLLPRYQKFLLWLVLQPDSFFAVGKEEHTKREAEQNIPRGTSGKISSKQIGDELTNGRKLENGKFIPPPPPPEYAQQHHLQQQSDSGEKNNPVAQAFDAGRMWPLTCFELSISVDQEDRFLSALKRVQEYEPYPKKNSQMAAATRMAYNLKEAVRYQVYTSTFRKRKAFLEILTPRQALLYKKWLLSNRERCKQVLEERKKGSLIAADTAMAASSEGSDVDGNLTLEALCRNLEEILKISKVTPSAEAPSPAPMDTQPQQQDLYDFGGM